QNVEPEEGRERSDRRKLGSAVVADDVCIDHQLAGQGSYVGLVDREGANESGRHVVNGGGGRRHGEARADSGNERTLGRKPLQDAGGDGGQPSVSQTVDDRYMPIEKRTICQGAPRNTPAKSTTAPRPPENHRPATARRTSAAAPVTKETGTPSGPVTK